jgi:hypothetical protein
MKDTPAFLNLKLTDVSLSFKDIRKITVDILFTGPILSEIKDKTKPTLFAIGVCPEKVRI